MKVGLRSVGSGGERWGYLLWLQCVWWLRMGVLEGRLCAYRARFVTLLSASLLGLWGGIVCISYL